MNARITLNLDADIIKKYGTQESVALALIEKTHQEAQGCNCTISSEAVAAVFQDTRRFCQWVKRVAAWHISPPAFHRSEDKFQGFQYAVVADRCKARFLIKANPAFGHVQAQLPLLEVE